MGNHSYEVDVQPDLSIAIAVNPDALTWDMLDSITESPEVLDAIIERAKRFILFTEEQEREMERAVYECITVELLKPRRFIGTQFINWTDITYALIKSYPEKFKHY